MTPYEILDLRRSYLETFLGSVRWWISTTIGVLVAAYVAGRMGLRGQSDNVLKLAQGPVAVLSKQNIPVCGCVSHGHENVAH